ncbi:MAG TPA: aminoglycoside phosphotransferase family protein [Terriglobales bacterium]|nr:aminoglycoside phosphotransferase family protein [Terriglobales bacterium]
MSFVIPALLAKHCAKTAERKAWLGGLPNTIRCLERRWSLSLGAPYEHSYVSCSWVAPAIRAHRTRAVLKIGMPHFEGEQEMEGLRFWDGRATARLLEWDQLANAMLLEQCEPGTPLLSIPETEQDVIVTTILRRLWLKPPPQTFRPLAALMAHWNEHTRKSADTWSDAVLVTEGLQVLTAMAADPSDDFLLATDLHSGNILRAQREPWLMIDPKPFVGDRAYDLTQHLFNCEQRLQTNPHELIVRIAELAGVDDRRVRLWLFGRAAAEPRDHWRGDWKLELARRLSL